MPRRFSPLITAAVLALIAACGSSASPTPSPTPAPARMPTPTPTFVDVARTGTGAPRFQIVHAPPPPATALHADPRARTARTTAEAAARWHLARHADALGLDPSTLASVEVVLVHDRGHGPIVVKLGQRIGGVPVIRTSLALVMDRSLGLIAISGELAPVVAGFAAPRFALSAADAIDRAIDDTGAGPRLLHPIADAAGYRRFTADGLVSPARVRAVYYPAGGQLVPAYQAELAFAAGNQGYRHVLAADDGRVLYRAGLTSDAVFDYRVWADAGGNHRPKDGPVTDYTPHPTGVPDGFAPAFAAPSLIAMDGFNAAPGGGSDPWLPAGATVTTGNNVDAYADLDFVDGFSGGDLRPDITSPGAFDRSYDLAAEPGASPGQIKAAATQLFYVDNWLHDYWYDSGFTEAAGNAQQNNLGRGGIGGDPLHAEAQDSSGTDNANMFTPADGDSPRMQMYVWTAPAGGAAPDGTIDNDIIAHEWGHYLHHRLVDCGSQECGAMSEGWGDFDGLMLTVRPGDNLSGVYGLGWYALQSYSANAAYFGIRRYPYTTNLARNPLTFRMVRSGEPLPAGPPYTDVSFLQGADNWEVHDAGEIWCSMLYTGLADLLADSQGPAPRFTFEQGRRRMADYVVAGMIAAPVEPTFTEQRDAILSAALAADPQDFAVLAQAFAKRGFGGGAVSPPVDSFDGSGVVEDFAVRGRPELVSAQLVEDPGACDADGVLDAGESGTLVIEIRNVGAAALHAPIATVSSSTLGVVFPAGATAVFADIAQFATATAVVPVRLTETQPVETRLRLQLAMSEPSSPLTPVVANIDTDANLDLTLATASIDDVESPFPVWATTGELQRTRLATTSVWSGPPPLGPTDAILTSPALTIGAAPFSITFQNRYAFGGGDGGLIEVSTNGGTTWVDASTLGTTGYTGTIPTGVGDPLGGRAAWTGTSPGYPAFATTTVDFATALAGQTATLRFRMGGDAVADGTGAWQLDDLAVTGAGTPFPTTTIDDGSCLPGQRPIAVAGPDSQVDAGAIVTLDGTGSSDPEGTSLTYYWQQVAGTIVAFGGVTSAHPHFTAPNFVTPHVLTFQLRVTDADGRVSVPDTVAITVEPPMPTPDAAPPDAGLADAAPPAPDAGDSADAAAGPPDAGLPALDGVGGCSCRTTGDGGAPGSLMLIAVVMVGLRRRR